MVKHRVPEEVASPEALNVTGSPGQMTVGLAESETVGEGFTLIPRVTEFEHPLASVTLYVITTLPVATPVTTPVLGSTEAMDELLLVHIPPEVTSNS